jgi:TIR domain
MDIDEIKVGDRLSRVIEQGLQSADYYLLCISESAKSSPWVQRELSFAIQLADRNKLSTIPFLMNNVDLPLELSGLLYIDGRNDFDGALGQLGVYLDKQDRNTLPLESAPDWSSEGHQIQAQADECVIFLGRLKRGDLRYHMTERLTLEAVSVLWYDLFERQMESEIRISSLALSVIELLERADRDEELGELIRLICRNHPRFVRAVKKATGSMRDTPPSIS